MNGILPLRLTADIAVTAYIIAINSRMSPEDRVSAVIFTTGNQPVLITASGHTVDAEQFEKEAHDTDPR